MVSFSKLIPIIPVCLCAVYQILIRLTVVNIFHFHLSCHKSPYAFPTPFSNLGTTDGFNALLGQADESDLMQSDLILMAISLLFSCLAFLQEVLRNLVKRYVAAMIRDAKTEEGLTEENFKVTKSFL